MYKYYVNDSDGNQWIVDAKNRLDAICKVSGNLTPELALEICNDCDDLDYIVTISNSSTLFEASGLSVPENMKFSNALFASWLNFSSNVYCAFRANG